MIVVDESLELAAAQNSDDIFYGGACEIVLAAGQEVTLRNQRHEVEIEFSRADFDAAVTEYVAWRGQFCDETGALKHQYAPAPMVASFMRAEGEADDERTAIPVPKGPVDTW